MRWLAMVILAGASGVTLGPVLRRDGWSMRPPQAFHPVRTDLFHGTRAGAPATRPATPRFLSTALVDGDGDDAAALTLSIVEADFSLGPGARDEASTSVLRHFREELEQPFALERVDVAGEGSRRVEVLGSVRQQDQLRRVLVAVYPGEGRHVVALASVPSGRWEALKGPLRESLDTLRLETPSAGPPMRWRWAFAAFMGALLMVSVGLWRRRWAERREAQSGAEPP